ncbi:MAG: CRISPR-associated helicase Cas3' [Dermatophilaceae bacterium]
MGTTDTSTASPIPLEVFWGKSDAGGAPHSLIGHLLDTTAVAELVHDDFLAPSARQSLDAGVPGRGRDLLRVLAGWHDVGKACPKFQGMVPDLAKTVVTAGLPITPSSKRWHHTQAGAFALTRYLRAHGRDDLLWLVPIVEGHHGRFGPWVAKCEIGHGLDWRWDSARVGLFDRVLDELGVDRDALTGPPPSKGVQIALAGLVSMSDWIASSSECPGIGLRDLDLTEARQRAERAWRRLGLTGGWPPSVLRDDEQVFAARMGVEPRPLQALAVQMARTVTEPCLMIVEAPMGEGKTEAAFAATEVLARRLGADGYVFAMPTQGTTDAMYERVCRWARSVDPASVVSLRHGKAMANESFRTSIADEAVAEVDHDDVDEYGMQAESIPLQENAGPVQWLLGRHRALLSSGVVGTVDQVLYAGTRTKYVALRHAGLLGKVLIIDEVHSYDVYMEQFLTTVLRWCADAGVPVILMSATLAPALRSRLVGAYATAWDGAATIPPSIEPSGYPSVVIADRSGRLEERTAPTWRPDQQVSVSVLEADTRDDVEPLADAVAEEVRDGGCALVIVNVVARAQRLFSLLADCGIETVILHGRLTTSERARRTADLVDRLGAGRTRVTGRPEQLVVVATQIAEQSFDVDADVLFTDLAPMDLLLQRIGRLHRHDRAAADRPGALSVPRVIVSGMVVRADAPAEVARSFEYVYDRAALLRSAALLGKGASWAVPSQVPALVAAAYAPDFAAPTHWGDEVAAADVTAVQNKDARSERASTFVLKGDGRYDDLRSMHRVASVREGADEAVVVRDGEPSREVALVRRTTSGYATLSSGRSLGPNGEVDPDGLKAREVLGDTVRMREGEQLMGAVRLPAWRGEPLLSRLEALVLNEHGTCETDPRVRYDVTLGLLIDRTVATPGAAQHSSHGRRRQ